MKLLNSCWSSSIRRGMKEIANKTLIRLKRRAKKWKIFLMISRTLFRRDSIRILRFLKTFQKLDRDTLLFKKIWISWIQRKNWLLIQKVRQYKAIIRAGVMMNSYMRLKTKELDFLSKSKNKFIKSKNLKIQSEILKSTFFINTIKKKIF